MNHLTKLFQIGAVALLVGVTSPDRAVAVAPQSGSIDVTCTVEGSLGFDVGEGGISICFTGTITCEGQISGTFEIDTCNEGEEGEGG